MKLKCSIHGVPLRHKEFNGGKLIYCDKCDTQFRVDTMKSQSECSLMQLAQAGETVAVLTQIREALAVLLSKNDYKSRFALDVAVLYYKAKHLLQDNSTN